MVINSNYKDYKLKSGNILRVIPDSDPESPDKWENEDMFLVYNHRQFSVKREGFEPKDVFNALTLEYPKEPISDDYETEEEYIDARDEYHADTDDVNSIKAEFLDYFIFPVDAYIHSGVHLSLANTTNYPDRRWDVSTTGYVLVKKDAFGEGIVIKRKVIVSKNGDIELDKGLNEILICPSNQLSVSDVHNSKFRFKNIKNREIEIEIRIGKLQEYKAKEYAEGLIETWNQYLSDDVYGFQVLKPVKTYKIHQHQFEAIEVIEPVNNIPMGLLYKENFLKLAEEKIEYEKLDSCWGFYGSDPKTNGMLENINDEIIEEI